jgi:hypothetical protein
MAMVLEGFLEAYRLLLQRAVDEIWAGIRWVVKYDGRGGRRLMKAPINPKNYVSLPKTT